MSSQATLHFANIKNLTNTKTRQTQFTLRVNWVLSSFNYEKPSKTSALVSDLGNKGKNWEWKQHHNGQ
jgi:hypothetical protein